MTLSLPSFALNSHVHVARLSLAYGGEDGAIGLICPGDLRVGIM